MASISISLYNDPHSGRVVLYCSAHGVQQGRYGDLWSVRQELTPDSPDAMGALLALSLWIQGLHKPT